MSLRPPLEAAELVCGVGAQVSVDGVVVGTSPLAASLFLTPGSHTLAVTASGHKTNEQTLDAKKGTEGILEVILVPRSDAQANPAHPPPPALAPTPDEPQSTESEVSPLLWVGVALAGAGLVTGAVAGGISLSRGSDIQSRCADSVCNENDAALQDDHSAALVSAHVSTAGFAVGGAGLGLAVVGLLLSDFGTTEAAFIMPTANGVRVMF